MSRRVSVPAVILVALLAFVLGAVFGSRAPRVLSRRPAPPDPPPSSRHVLDGINVGAALLACKPAGAVLIVTPRTDPCDGCGFDDGTEVPFVSAVAEWDGPTDVLEVRRTFLIHLRQHFEPRGLLCYGPGIDPAREGNPDLAQEIFRCDTADGVCAAFASLAVHIVGDRCKVKASVWPAQRWLMPR